MGPLIKINRSTRFFFFFQSQLQSNREKNLTLYNIKNGQIICLQAFLKLTLLHLFYHLKQLDNLKGFHPESDNSFFHHLYFNLSPQQMMYWAILNTHKQHLHCWNQHACTSAWQYSNIYIIQGALPSEGFSKGTKHSAQPSVFHFLPISAVILRPHVIHVLCMWLLRLFICHSSSVSEKRH